MNVVQKYGGTCIDTVEKILGIAKHTAEIKKEGDQIVIVASAMGKTTDELIALAKETGPVIPKRELNTLLATGEHKSVALLAIALQNIGVDAVSMTGFQSGFITTDRYTKAKIKEIHAEKLERYLKEGKVVVVAGFQGISDNVDMTAPGRGGSDVTAVAIAAQLGWECEMYTTVDCIYTADPEIYPQTKPLKSITYEEIMEISSLGLNVIERRSVELAKKHGVKLFVGKALEKDKSKGTYVMNNNLLIEDRPITGISVQEDCSIFSIRKIKNDGAAVANLFRLLADVSINVDMISQQTTGENECSISFSCSNKQADALEEVIKGNNDLQSMNIERQSLIAFLCSCFEGHCSLL